MKTTRGVNDSSRHANVPEFLMPHSLADALFDEVSHFCDSVASPPILDDQDSDMSHEDSHHVQGRDELRFENREGIEETLGCKTTVPCQLAQLTETVFQQLNITPELRPRLLDLIADEVKKRLPDFVKIAAVCSLLPVLQQRAARFFALQDVSDSESLSGDFIVKVYKSLFGCWPKGNLGAWISAIRVNLLLDQRRKNKREYTAVGRKQETFPIDALISNEASSDAWHLIIETLSPNAQSVLSDLREGMDWSEIANRLGMSVEEAQSLIHSLNGPVGSLRPKRRAKKRSSSRSASSKSCCSEASLSSNGFTSIGPSDTVL